MFEVINGMIQHKGKFYRKGEQLPDSFTNKQGYKHVKFIDESVIEGEFTDVSADKLEAQKLEADKLEAENEKKQKKDVK